MPEISETEFKELLDPTCAGIEVRAEKSNRAKHGLPDRDWIKDCSKSILQIRYRFRRPTTIFVSSSSIDSWTFSKKKIHDFAVLAFDVRASGNAR